MSNSEKASSSVEKKKIYICVVGILQLSALFAQVERLGELYLHRLM